mgnify:CR=1 FL=1
MMKYFRHDGWNFADTAFNANQSINNVRLKFQEEFSTKSSEMLFGKDCTVHKAFDLLDKDKNGEVSGFIFVQCRYMADIYWIWLKQ